MLYRIVKASNYGNKDSLSLTGKIPSDILEGAMKDYLLYLVEKKTPDPHH